jgi:hypothetical protein
MILEYIGPKFRYHISKFFVQLITSFRLVVFLTKSDQLNFSRNLKNQLPVSPHRNFLEFCAKIHKIKIKKNKKIDYSNSNEI